VFYGVPLVSGFLINKLVICGVGLIGGSLACALRATPGNVGELVGVDCSATALARARALGMIDASAVLDDDAQLRAALVNAQIVLLAVPVAQTGPLLGRIAPFLDSATIVTDAGSTKSAVIAAARAVLGPRSGQFVPAHPIAGRERSGVDAACADLYAARQVVLCALPENPATAVGHIEAMWRAAGAEIRFMTAAQHDHIFAAVSHLPHLLSFALVTQILAAPDADLQLSYAAGGFRDFTRIAASQPEMWRDICLTNRAALLDALDAYETVLNSLRTAIDAEDGAALAAVFARARGARAAWREHGGGEAPASL